MFHKWGSPVKYAPLMGRPSEGLLQHRVIARPENVGDVNMRGRRTTWEGKLGGNSFAFQSLQTKPGTGPTDRTLPPTTAQYGSLDSDVVKNFCVQQGRGPTVLPHLTISPRGGSCAPLLLCSCCCNNARHAHYSQDLAVASTSKERMLVGGSFTW